MQRPPRLYYAAGPGDVLGTYKHWKQGRDDPGQVALTYSGQFYDVCQATGARALVVSSCVRGGSINDGMIRIIQRPRTVAGLGALSYHLTMLRSFARLAADVLWFRPDAAVISDSTTHTFLLPLLRLLGTKPITTQHCVLYIGDTKPGGLGGGLLRLARPYFRRHAAAIISVSRQISRQIEDVAGARPVNLIEFLPTYRREQFTGIPSPDRSARPFRVFFAGRIEPEKGAFDLLEIARRLDRAGRHDIEFDLCGDGSALAQLRQEVQQAGLADRFRCHGHCDRPRMRQRFTDAHVIIVPTRTTFVEGFNKVVVEGVLSGRPVITSSVCPALEYVREAVVEVPPDDIDAYEHAIVRLCDDPDFYERHRQACADRAASFFDEDTGWAAAVIDALRRLRVIPVAEPRPRAVEAT